MAPLQDTPSVKYSYGACITVENTLHAYMSANITSSFVADNPAYNTTCFQMSYPIPSYLIAVAIGDIAYQYIGGRCAILTEPGFMQQAVWEFSNLNQLLSATEQYVGTPYMWGIYQLLILPPSMPFGGMENPLLNFVSPTIVTGTKSQVYVVIHEMAHSWTGDQVTMNNW